MKKTIEKIKQISKMKIYPVLTNKIFVFHKNQNSKKIYCKVI